MTKDSVAVIVVAAGSGTRLGAAVPKAFVEIAGRTMLDRAVDGIRAAFGDDGAEIVVVLPAPHAEWTRPTVKTVVGADARQGSVAAGLSVLAPEVEIVLVHDAARALTPPEQFRRVRDAVAETQHGVVPGLPVTDTIKRVDGALVVETLDRSVLAAMQTPQGFPRAALEAAYASAQTEHTDDAALVAQHGLAVELVSGDTRAFKITTPDDLARAEAMVKSALPAGEIRTGIGMDVHAYDDAAPLWLGGLYWPDEPGLKGHSDGDALCHALCDALLSAAGLGDIGSHFGTSDPRYAGAHGDVFVEATVELLRGSGFGVVNVAVQIVANRPRVGARRAEIESHLTALVGAPVSVSATTTDGLGFTGRGEGVSAVATALVRTL